MRRVVTVGSSYRKVGREDRGGGLTGLTGKGGGHKGQNAGNAKVLVGRGGDHEKRVSIGGISEEARNADRDHRGRNGRKETAHQM